VSALILLTSSPGKVFSVPEIWRAISDEHQKPEDAQRERVKVVIAEVRRRWLGDNGKKPIYNI